ncbi:putative mediator of RNA polymerase II transcription subunit 26 isoform X5 [Halichondria panicea]|uniref:putative mediator of RNA polymerase II transcription subunit 26 isoform X5 n=1 Tax=Halichondria panicea TaxID=6063 RepID=UPI00312BC5E2
MRCICDEKVHAMAKERHAFEECIQNLTRELQGLSNEKEGLLEIRAFTRQHKPQQNDKQIHELQEQLYVAHQKAITAQEEVQAKTAQVKQYKKKDDQREEKLISLDVRNQELVQEMERVRSELIKAKTESANLLKEEKKLNQNEMKKICLELERALKKTSKSKAHDELLKVELVNNSLRVDKERLSGSLQEVQEQFARLKLELKKEVTNTIPTTPPTYTESTIPIQPNQVSVKHDTPQARSSHPTAIPRPDPNNEHSIAQQPPTMPNVNIVPQATQDNYNPQPEARLVPNSPTEGRSSMNFDDPRPAYDRVEVNGFRNAAGQNERQSSTGPQPDNSIRYPPGLQVKQSHSSAPSSTNLALSEQAASPTDALNRMSLVLGDQQLERPSNIPSDFSQSQYPANTHQGGGYQDPVSNYQGQSGFDNLPQDQYQNQYMHQNQPRRESPSMHRHPSQWPNHDQFHQMEVTNTTTQPPIPIQGHYQDRYQNQPQPRNVPPSNHPSQWPNQQPYLQDHLYQQQPDEQYEHPFSQRQSFQWDNTSSQERMESQNYPNRRSPHNYPRSLSYPAHISSQEDSSLSSTSLSESPNPSYSPTQVAMLPPPQARPRPKPRKANRKLSQQREENELEKGLSTEIKKIVGDLFYQQYESEKQQTNEQVPPDPNLVCHVCSKQHRLGEIQKYRKHVKECEREQGVRAEEAAAKLASDTKPFSIKHSTDPRD